MWLLVSVSNNDIRYPILGDHKFVVGRQNCDIVVPDASVSRKQAVLTMAHYETSVVKSYIMPILTLEDVSKFGTLVNGKAVKNPGGSTVTLKHNDEIRFGGTPASIFKAVYEPFVATTSCLEKAPKKLLLKTMCLLGGHLVRDWRPVCDLLIMSKINVTIKVICAINNQKHIVTPQYLDDLYSHLMGRRDKPDPASYLPEVVDQEVPPGVSFHPDIRRMTLLQGLKFYFLSAVQFNKTNLAVSTAGGQPILLEDGTEEEAEAMTEDKTVVVAVSREILPTFSQSCQKFVKLVISVLKRKGLRMVTDPEIGWAILTCNMADFCNARSSIMFLECNGAPDMLSYMAVQSMSQSVEADISHSSRQVDLSHSSQQVDVKPVARSIVVVHSQNTSVIEDMKPVVGIMKPEKLSPHETAVKTEAVEEQLEIRPSDLTLQASQRRLGLGNKSSALSAQMIVSPADSAASRQPRKESAVGSSAVWQSKDDATSDSSAIKKSKDDPISNSTAIRKCNDDSTSDSAAIRKFKDAPTSGSSAVKNPKEDSGTRPTSDTKSKEDSPLSTSAITHPKENANSQGRGMSSHPQASQSIDAEAFVADSKAAKNLSSTQEDNPEETVSVFARQKRKFQSKHQNNHWEDSGDEMAESSKGQRLKQKPRNLFDDADDDTDASVTKRRKTEQSEKNQHNREFDSEAFDLTSKFRDNNRSDVGDGDLFDVGDRDLSDWDESEAASADRSCSKDSSRKAASSDFTCGKNISRGAEQENTHILDSNGGSSKNVSYCGPVSTDGWLNTKKSKVNQDREAAQNGHAGVDTKPDTELLRDSEGRPLTNLCQIEVVDLIAKRDPSRIKSAQSRPSGKGQPNFKRFRKTQNAGSGRLPTIIGGRDLEVHLGSKHQNIEDLFSASLAQENERQEKDLRDADLFNWDERTRKTSNKRIR